MGYGQTQIEHMDYCASEVEYNTGCIEEAYHQRIKLVFFFSSSSRISLKSRSFLAIDSNPFHRFVILYDGCLSVDLCVCLSF